jgi:hypothetical protein
MAMDANLSRPLIRQQRYAAMLKHGVRSRYGHLPPPQSLSRPVRHSSGSDVVSFFTETLRAGGKEFELLHRVETPVSYYRSTGYFRADNS